VGDIAADFCGLWDTDETSGVGLHTTGTDKDHPRCLRPTLLVVLRERRLGLRGTSSTCGSTPVHITLETWHASASAATLKAARLHHFF
jgi:hypothetical protein